MTAGQHAAVARGVSPTQWVLRGLVAAALIVDAVVHLRLASDYQLAVSSGIGAGNLFRLEAAAAILAAGYVLLRGNRTAYLIAFVVAFSALVAVILYRYVDVPQLGPLPAMYEPIWFFEKNVSAIAEAVGAAAAVMGLLNLADTTDA